MKNLSKQHQHVEYYQVMKKRIQYYSDKYDPYRQYISSLDRVIEELPMPSRREKRLSHIHSFFVNIF